MTNRLRAIAIMASLSMFLSPFAQVHAHDGCNDCCPACGCAEGGKCVEVTTHRCKMVPETKPIKKTVYECKKVPYCEHALGEFGHASCCSKCQSCAKYKTVLIKKEIKCGEKCEMKCVTEEVKVMVPVACPKCGHHCKHHRLLSENESEVDAPVRVADVSVRNSKSVVKAASELPLD